ncbi:MAG: hypothetical protein ABIC57_01930 [bacterium]
MQFNKVITGYMLPDIQNLKINSIEQKSRDNISTSKIVENIILNLRSHFHPKVFELGPESFTEIVFNEPFDSALRNRHESVRMFGNGLIFALFDNFDWNKDHWKNLCRITYLYDKDTDRFSLHNYEGTNSRIIDPEQNVFYRGHYVVTAFDIQTCAPENISYDEMIDLLFDDTTQFTFEDKFFSKTGNSDKSEINSSTE